METHARRARWGYDNGLPANLQIRVFAKFSQGKYTELLDHLRFYRALFLISSSIYSLIVFSNGGITKGFISVSRAS